MTACRRVGYWISEKKSKKLNFEEQKDLFRNANLELIQIDLDKSMEEQGPFDMIVHKVADEMVKGDQGDIISKRRIKNFEDYVKRHPNCIVIDPIENMQMLINRYKQYKMFTKCDVMETDSSYSTPSFVVLDSMDKEENKNKLKQKNIQYPFLCKPLIAQGSSNSHKLAIMFDEKGLDDIFPPCIAQTFINHNAVLYKIFVVGQKQYIIKRPSIKNMYPGDHPTIFFDTSKISKSNSSHFLTKVDPGEDDVPCSKPDNSKIRQFGESIQRELNMDLFGADIIIDNKTNKYAVIDCNAFPGYDGVDNFFQVLIDFIWEKLNSSDKNTNPRVEKSSNENQTINKLYIL